MLFWREKKNEKKNKLKKGWENYYFDCPRESDIQTLLFCLQPRVNEISKGFDPARSEFVN